MNFLLYNYIIIIIIQLLILYYNYEIFKLQKTLIKDFLKTIEKKFKKKQLVQITKCMIDKKFFTLLFVVHIWRIFQSVLLDYTILKHVMADLQN